MISETLIKTLAKAIDFEKIVAQLQADPRVNEALALAANIQQDFATIKNTQAEILARLDNIDAALNVAEHRESARARRKAALPAPTQNEE